MSTISYQLYSSRDWPQDETITMLGQLGFDAVEGFGPYLDALAKIDGIKAQLDAAGLKMVSAHFSVDMVENQPDHVLKVCEGLGITHVYAPYLMPEDRPTDAAGWTAFGERLQNAAQPYKAAGLTFGWHNHDFEFEVLPTGEIPEDLLLAAAPDVTVELDVAWVVRGGQDPIATIKRYGKRITAAHVKDLAPAGEKTDEGGWADPGTGTMDWPAIMAALKEHTSAEVFVCEHDNPSDHNRFATNAINYVRGL